MEKRDLLYEGKAKKLYETDRPNVLWVEYKDDLTAFNGEKKASQLGKGKLNNKISSLLLQYLKEKGIYNHFIQQLSDHEQLVEKTTIIPIEVVVRNTAAGSLAKRLGLPEGEKLKSTIVEYYYKDDDLGDPLINEDHIELLDLVDSASLNEMKELSLKVNRLLSELFQSCDLQLVDFKLEFGRDRNGEVALSDEISPDTCRLWDVATNEKLDKDVFRQNLGSVEEAYQTILNRLEGAVTHG
ncbi:phosphoribosylaminoimidazolesuccinocarboxamide synthase [Halalkalibacillus sediminis]|uniref:Phosphoribosylaminoimidazole-succinocarboxamide synthase n=1 Tax=Halalkalibacillus sediminis TaxID=2018042 RepID=A0A2I0QR60_9BACI|nr:phosphoribosylaminoimidazolesuccinocarboxamide synthase [Halalkalibacillus sediminis]PKR76560.1 phosphoribosylaminoimidazolesuccinocarboxamide synthase [Halalkalibacillus sediminis]